MKPMILAVIAAASLMAAQNTPAPASSTPAAPKSTTSAPATPAAPADAKVKRHNHKKPVSATPATPTSASKPAGGDASKSAVPASK